MPSLSDVGLSRPFKVIHDIDVKGGGSSILVLGIDIGAMAVYL